MESQKFQLMKASSKLSKELIAVEQVHCFPQSELLNLR